MATGVFLLLLQWLAFASEDKWGGLGCVFLLLLQWLARASEYKAYIFVDKYNGQLQWLVRACEDKLSVGIAAGAYTKQVFARA